MIDWRTVVVPLLALASCGPAEEDPPSVEIELPQCHVYQTANPGPLSDDWQIRGCDDDEDCVGYDDDDQDRKCINRAGGCCGPVVCSVPDDPLCPEQEQCINAGSDGVLCYDDGRDCCLCLFHQECLYDNTLGPPRDDFATVDLCASEADSLPDMPSLFVGYDCRDANACDGCWAP